jgi:hypothetical protein
MRLLLLNLTRRRDSATVTHEVHLHDIITIWEQGAYLVLSY